MEVKRRAVLAIPVDPHAAKDPVESVLQLITTTMPANVGLSVSAVARKRLARMSVLRGAFALMAVLLHCPAYLPEPPRGEMAPMLLCQVEVLFLMSALSR
jgi:hypothetical protein